MGVNVATQYPANSTPPDASYPGGSFKDDVVPGDFSGTPWQKIINNDIQGFLQSLIAFSGITVSGVPDTILASDYFDSLQQLINQNSQYLVDTGAADIYAASGTPNYTVYTAGMKIRALIANTNTGASTFNLDLLGAKSIVKFVNTPLEPGDLPAGMIAEFQYDGTNMQLLNPVRRLGAWDAGAPWLANTTYQAPSDGFVTAFNSVGDNLSALTDAATPPTIERNRGHDTVANLGCPVVVRRNHFWRINSSAGTPTIFFIPFT